MCGNGWGLQDQTLPVGMCITNIVYVHRPGATSPNTAWLHALHMQLCLHVQVSLQNVEASYINPSVLDTCQEYTGREIMAMQASLGEGAVVPLSGTAVSVEGRVRISVLVSGGDTQRTGGQLAFADMLNSLVVGSGRTARRVTLHCDYHDGMQFQ